MATRWLLAGASGFLGTALRVRLAERGDEVRCLVRRDPVSVTESRWNPDAGEIDVDALRGVDVVINLCGVGVFERPWTAGRRELIISSRENPGRTLSRALAQLAAAGEPVPSLIQASGIARYGTSSGDHPYTEDDPAAGDYLAQVTVRWEASAQQAAQAGVRVVHLRTSPVLDRSGGAFVPMRLAWLAGLGAKLGDGRQRMPMISLDDYLGVVEWAAGNEAARGAYNLTLPQPTTNAEFSDVLAAAVHRPRLLAMPAPVLRTALGELSGQLLGDVWAVPQRLVDEGFVFTAPDVGSTVEAALRSGAGRGASA